MGAIRSSATALLSVGVATGAVFALGTLGTPAATTATAAEAEAKQVTSFGFAVTPPTVAPGGQTLLSVSGCNAAYATASSGVFDTVSIFRGRTVRVTVDRDARIGAVYSVSFTCNGETGSADLTIAGGSSRPTTSSTQGAITPPRAVTTSASTLGVRGGLGGSVAGMNPVELGTGAALFLAAAAGTVYTLRRRGSSRGH
ncbi:hypothetical protein [Streptomyces sp. ISL-94]|uniref:hypothetical protein n=1 Tax=Streptomyces sp. ISL-94 TaxID=2819190 RepID=UPI001BEC8949|nr:hypothetical protein [Streptomyces sp. ISL-94]MBT2477479.1 hypothetical protein [Streptomyces sp. ISL-94]